MADSGRHPDLERRINEQLEAIDRALVARGVPLAERRSVTGDVEAQIRDMLAERVGDRPSAADVEAVLQVLDAPESYGEDSETPSTDGAVVAVPGEPRRFSRAAVLGAVWAPLVLAILVLVVAIARTSAAHAGGQPPEASWAQTGSRLLLLPLGLLGLLAPFGTTVLGWIAVGQIRRSNGQLYGLGLALADGLFFPLILLDVLIYLFWRVAIAVAIAWKSLGIGALGRPSYSAADNNPMLIFVLAAITALLVDWLIARWAWRKVSVSAEIPATD